MPRISKLLLAMILLAILKLWLVAPQRMYAYGPAGHDDRLFLILADSLRAWKWLGPYNQLTLAKGPMYPLWVAFSYRCGLPLLRSQHLLYAFACILFALAIRPVVPRAWLVLAIYSVLLFNPITFTSAMLGVHRASVYQSLTLLIVACALGLFTFQDRPRRQLAAWAVGLGLALSAFWLTREEGIWLAPSLTLLVGYSAYTLWRSRNADRRERLLLNIVPFLILGCSLLTVCTLNKAYYGVFATVEFKAPEFISAYGSLCRVDHAHWRRYVPVPKETREEIYRYSPTFAELRPFLEGPLGDSWTAPSATLPGGEDIANEIAGGWFMWALRDAVAAAGYCCNGKTAMVFYDRLAREVNRACDDCVLPAGPRRSTMLPPWRSDYGPLLVRSLADEARMLVGMEGFSSESPPSIGPRHTLPLFEKLTRERLSPLPEDAAASPAPTRITRLRLQILQQIGALYRHTVPWAAISAVLAYCLAILRSARTRRLGLFLVLNTAMLGAILARMAILAYIDVTSFPAISIAYLSAAVPLLLLFCLLTVLDLFEICPNL